MDGYQERKNGRTRARTTAQGSRQGSRAAAYGGESRSSEIHRRKQYSSQSHTRTAVPASARAEARRQRARTGTYGGAGTNVYRTTQARTSSRRNRELDQLLEIEEENQKEYEEYLERKRKREAKRRREELARKQRRALLVKAAGVMLLFMVFFFGVYKLFFSNPVLKRVTVEAGTKDLKVENFLKKDVDAAFVTDVSEVDTSHVGEQKIVLKAKGKERTSTLIVEDTKAPKAKADPLTVDVDAKVEASELVTDIEDATDVTCSFQEQPNLSKKGTVSAVVVLTDEGGNQSQVESEIKVINDTEAPGIDGVAPLTGFIGEPVSYKAEITVTDNCDREVELQVDNSDVDTEKEGTYDVLYTATDRAGNTAEAETTITMKEKPEDFVEPEEVYEEADAVLEEITTEDMTLKEKARAIYDWCRDNIGYVSTSDKDSWTNGAHQGFTEGEGDCFVFFATAKALLTEAGIPNIDVEKSDTSHSRHYWSLVDVGDGWYHFDTTPRQGGGEFFLKTDEEILKYSKAHDNSHIFDTSLYPATPTTDSTVE